MENRPQNTASLRRLYAFLLGIGWFDLPTIEEFVEDSFGRLTRPANAYLSFVDKGFELEVRPFWRNKRMFLDSRVNNNRGRNLADNLRNLLDKLLDQKTAPYFVTEQQQMLAVFCEGVARSPLDPNAYNAIRQLTSGHAQVDLRTPQHRVISITVKYAEGNSTVATSNDAEVTRALNYLLNVKPA